MATNNSVNTPLSGTTGTGQFAGSNSPVFVSPGLGVATATSIKFTNSNAMFDVNNNVMLNFFVAPSAVNYVTIANGSAGNPVGFNCLGTDPNISLNLSGKGTGSAVIYGTGTNDNAPPRGVGEFVDSGLVTGVVAGANGVTINITSISLTAGDWDIHATGYANGGATVTALVYNISTTSATISSNGRTDQTSWSGSIGFQFGGLTYKRLSLAATTTVYLCATSFYASGTAGPHSGQISARRVR